MCYGNEQVLLFGRSDEPVVSLCPLLFTVGACVCLPARVYVVNLLTARALNGGRVYKPSAFALFLAFRHFITSLCSSILQIKTVRWRGKVANNKQSNITNASSTYIAPPYVSLVHTTFPSVCTAQGRGLHIMQKPQSL